MCRFTSILTLLFLLLMHVGSLAQPLEEYGCHMRYIKANHAVDRTLENHLWSATLERSDTFDILDYDLTIDLRAMGQSNLIGKAVITFQPKMEARTHINLDLLKLSVDSVYVGNREATYIYDDLLLAVYNDDPFDIDSIYTVTVYYHGRPTTSSSGFGGFYFEDGIAYNLGIGLTDDPHNFGRSWFPCFDNFVERSTYTYRVITPAHITSYTVGNLTDDQPVDSTARIRTFRMSQEIPTYLSAIAASTYTAHEYLHQSIYGELPVQLISKPGDQNNMLSSFKNLNNAIDALESWYGKYPFDRVGYVLTTRGAMEHPNNIAFPTSSISGGIESRRLISHELCHLWWGNLLTLKTQADMWIKEGNAEYGSHLFDEYLNGRESFERLVAENRYEVITKAHIDDGSYLPLSPMPKYITYGTTTYRKGAMVMHSLRGYLGDDLFRQGQQDVLEQYAYQNLTAQSYRDALSQHTDVDITDFFNRWVLDSGFYDVVIHDFQPSDIGPHTHTLTIKQKLLKASDFLKDAPVSITFIDEKNQFIKQRVTVTGELTEIPLTLSFEPKAVLINNPMDLNLAQFNTLRKISKTGSQSFTYSGLNTNVTSIEDSTYVYIEHHLTAPDAHTDGSMSMNNQHFWKVSIADPEKISMTGRLDYNLTWDRNLLQHGEDSIALVYRSNGNQPWQIYAHTNKLMGSPNDKKGSFILTTMLSGDYAIANVDPVLLSTKPNIVNKVKIFPNPTTGSFYLNTSLAIPGGNHQIILWLVDEAGNIVMQQKHSVSNQDIAVHCDNTLASGSYHILLTDLKQRLLGHGNIILINH